MKLKFTRLCALVLTLLLLATSGLWLVACKKEAAEDGAPAVRVLNADTLQLTVKLDEELYRAHKKETVFLYEYAPSEGTSSAIGNAPIASAKLSSTVVEIDFPLQKENGARDRLYATYLLAAADGTLLTPSPIAVSDAHILAAHTGAFPNETNIKGLRATNAEPERLLAAAHTMTELRVSELVSDTGAYSASLFDVALCLNEAVIATLDTQIKQASRADMQVSLSLVPDSTLPLTAYAAIFDFLATRYDGGEYGLLTAFLIGSTEECTSDASPTLSPIRAAELLRIASLALTSRVSCGRAYLTVGGETAAIEAYLAQVNAHTSRENASFGVALLPDSTVSSAEEGANERLTLSNLSQLVQALKKQRNGARIAVVGLSFSAENPQLQAALCTYAYHASLNAKADFMIYTSPVGDGAGLYTAAFGERPAARAFRLADTGDNAEGERLAASLLSSDWQKLNRSVRSARLTLTGVGNLGSTEDIGKRLFDFSGGQAPAFVAIGNATEPQTVHSASFSSNVLVASLGATESGVGSGYRARLSSEDLEGAYVLSAKLLGQAASATHVKITLTLDGTTTDGRALSYSASVTAEANLWQTVSFRVRDYTEQMSLASPTSLTLLLQPCDASGTPIVADASNARASLWLHSVNLRRAGKDVSLPLVIGIAVLGFSIGLLAVVLVPRLKRNHARAKIRTNKKKD